MNTLSSVLGLSLLSVAYGSLTDTFSDRDNSSDSNTTTCYGKAECSGDSITADYVYCGGYYGCYEAELQIEKDAYLDGFRGAQEADVYSDNDAYCGGYLGCFMADVFTKGDTICDGHSSCWHSEIVADNDIFILGYHAAGAAEIYGNSKDVTMYEFGSAGTIYSVIEEVDTIYNYGAYGLYYADINSDNVRSLNVWSLGRFGSNYAQIYCRSGSSCNVYCRDYGCYGLEIRCYYGAECKYTLYDSSCDSSPTILYSKDEDDDKEFDLLYQTRKEAKSLAKKEFLKKYNNKLDTISTQKIEDEDMDFNNKFEEIFNDVAERMNLIDGKLKNNNDKMLMIDTSMLRTNNNVINVDTSKSSFLDEENLFTAGGVIAGLVLLFGSHRLLFNKNKNDDNSGYQYQSI